jgi:hypothetical protein
VASGRVVRPPALVGYGVVEEVEAVVEILFPVLSVSWMATKLVSKGSWYIRWRTRKQQRASKANALLQKIALLFIDSVSKEMNGEFNI